MKSLILMGAVTLSAITQAADFTVQVRNNFFSPATLDIKVGDKVTWIQLEGVHNVVANNGSFNSGPARSGNWQFSHTFNTVGNFGYVCQPHAPGMAGTIRVTAANTPPTVSITEPANGATFLTSETITISANAADTGGSISKVEFFDGATSLGTDTVAPYSVSVTLAAGQHTLTAKATDNANATTTSAAVTITVNPPPNVPPTVSITAPSNNFTFETGAPILLTASAADSDGTITKVEFFTGAASIGSVTSQPFQFNWTSAPNGKITLTAVATDNANATTTSSPITVQVAARPTLAISRNTDGSLKISTVGTLGLTHTLQSNSDLRTANWIDVASGVPGRGGALTFDNLPTDLPAKAYRVVVK